MAKESGGEAKAAHFSLVFTLTVNISMVSSGLIMEATEEDLRNFSHLLIPWISHTKD